MLVAVVAIVRLSAADGAAGLRRNPRRMAVPGSDDHLDQSVGDLDGGALKLENWLYWMCGGLGHGLHVCGPGDIRLSAGLFLTYMVIAVFGFRAWLHQYRLQSA